MSTWICAYCHLGPGNDHRMCICRGFNYSVTAWEEAAGIHRLRRKSPNPESDSESEQEQITGEQIKAELCRILNELSPTAVLTDTSSFTLYETLKNYKINNK